VGTGHAGPDGWMLSERFQQNTKAYWLGQHTLNDLTVCRWVLGVSMGWVWFIQGNQTVTLFQTKPGFSRREPRAQAVFNPEHPLYPHILVDIALERGEHTDGLRI